MAAQRHGPLHGRRRQPGQHRRLFRPRVRRVDIVVAIAGGAMGERNGAFARLATTTYKRAWRKGPENPAIKRVTDILRKAAEEIEQAWEGPTSPESGVGS